MQTTTRTPHHLLSSLTLGLALLATPACKSKVDDKPKAKVEEAETPPEKQEQPAEAGDEAGDSKTLTLAADASKVGFIGAKVTGDHEGNFEKIDGTATVEGGAVTSLEITVDMTSMTTDDEKLTGHLSGTDFFDVGTHPTAKFTSLSITEKSGDAEATHEIAGNLEMKGQTKKVTFPATLEASETSAHGKAEFSINRKDWGINYAGKPDDLIKDDVALILDLKFE